MYISFINIFILSVISIILSLKFVIAVVNFGSPTTFFPAAFVVSSPAVTKMLAIEANPVPTASSTPPSINANINAFLILAMSSSNFVMPLVILSRRFFSLSSSSKSIVALAYFSRFPISPNNAANGCPGISAKVPPILSLNSVSGPFNFFNSSWNSFGVIFFMFSANLPNAGLIAAICKAISFCGVPSAKSLNPS